MDDLPPRSSWHVSKVSRWPERPCAEGLLEQDADALPVRMAIEQDGFVTGWDEGALGFEEDAVWFSGRVSSFCLMAHDMQARQATGFFFVETRLAFALRHPSREIFLAFEILNAENRNDWEDEERLALEIQRLLGRKEGGAGQSQYPPLALRPGIRPIRRSDWPHASSEAPIQWPLSLIFIDRTVERLTRALRKENV